MIECTVTNVDGTRCGLTEPHKLHKFTIAPPEEFFEDEDNDHMGEEQFDEYADELEGPAMNPTRILIEVDLFCKTPVWLIRRIRELEAQLAKEKPPERG